MTYDASDRKSIRRAEKAAKLAEQNRREVLVAIMSTTGGREWVWNRLSEAHVFGSTYDDNTGRMAFLEGQRSGGLSLLDDVLTACPDEFILAMREANGRRTIDNVRDTGPADAGQRTGGEDANGRDQGSASSQYDLFGDEAPGNEAVH